MSCTVLNCFAPINQWQDNNLPTYSEVGVAFNVRGADTALEGGRDDALSIRILSQCWLPVMMSPKLGGLWANTINNRLRLVTWPQNLHNALSTVQGSHARRAVFSLSGICPQAATAMLP